MHTIGHLIEIALQEDIGSGDITTDNLIPPGQKGTGMIVAKQPLVIAGLDVAKNVFGHLDPEIEFTPMYTDGDAVETGSTVVEMAGMLPALLKGERTALNFLQHLSGIATHVRSFMGVLENHGVRLVDTRKTTPGWRVLEKYAVRIGGAFNHRMGLYDGVLIKDNHIAAFGGIVEAVTEIRERVSHLIKIEVEVSDLSQVEEALNARADVIMLDNMDLDRVKAAVALVNGRALVEVSGNVTKSDLNKLAATGVDIISAGALTHSAMAVDLSMRIL